MAINGHPQIELAKPNFVVVISVDFALIERPPAINFYDFVRNCLQIFDESFKFLLVIPK